MTPLAEPVNHGMYLVGRLRADWKMSRQTSDFAGLLAARLRNDLQLGPMSLDFALLGGRSFQMWRPRLVFRCLPISLWPSSVRGNLRMPQ